MSGSGILWGAATDASVDISVDTRSSIGRYIGRVSINAGVSIKFEVGSWLEKSNRLYDQGAVRPLNLGGSRGMLPQKI